MSHPIISKWVRTYVAHAKRSLQAQCLLLMVNAPGSSSMAWGCIFLAWFRFTEPLRAEDRCQHILSKHVQPMGKQYVQSSQWYFFRIIWNHLSGLVNAPTQSYWCFILGTDVCILSSHSVWLSALSATYVPAGMVLWEPLLPIKPMNSTHIYIFYQICSSVGLRLLAPCLVLRVGVWWYN